MKMTIAVAGCALALSPAWAAERVMTGSDAAGSSSFNSGSKWDDGQPPSAGNTYRTGSNILRTPEGPVSDEYVFAGDRLTVNNGGSLAWKSAGTVTVADMVLEGTVGHWYGNLSQDARLFGGITIPAGATGRFQAAQGENDTRIFRVYSALSGGGTLELEMGNSNYVANVKGVDLLGDNGGFTGRTVLRGFGRLLIPSEEALGAPPAAFTANHLEFYGMALRATNSLALDDPTRGIRLNSTENPGQQRYPWGAFEVTGAHTVTVSCVISGTGALVKRGSGTLLLATNNTYTGATVVEAGLLRLDPAYDAVSGAVVVSGATAVVAGAGTLDAVTLAAGGTLLAEGDGWDVASLDVRDGRLGADLSAADPAVPLIRVAGALAKPAFGAFTVTVITNGAAPAAHKVLTAPNLAEFKDIDFCVLPPWLGTLSRSDDGTALLFTPTPPEDIAFKTASDPFGDTGFTNANWTTGLPPEASKTYVSRSYEMRLPPTGNNTFSGGRLIFDNGQNISLKNPSGIATIPDLTVMNNASFGMTEGGNSRLAGRILLHPVLDAGRSYALHVNGWSNQRSLHLYAELTGYGRLELSGLGDPASGNSVYNLLGESTNFYGVIRLNGNSNFWLRVTRESNLGGTLPAFRPDALIFNGGGLGATNDVTLADPNRGITLQTTGGWAGTTTDPGGFTNGTPAEMRRYEGGAVFRPEGEGVTLTVNPPITGAGSLTKAGPGTLVLGGDNSYTGLTTVVSGALRAVSPNALGTGPVTVKAGATLQVPYPAAAMPNGVELGAAPAFEPGARVEVALAPGHAVAGNFAVPLFLLPPGKEIDPAAVPLAFAVDNYTASVVAETVGQGAEARVRISAAFRFNSTVLMLR